MIILRERHGLIDLASSDDGRIVYNPFHNGRIVIDGRAAWRGEYLDPKTEKVTGERVETADWEAACVLMRAESAAREAWHEAARQRAFDRLDAEDAYYERLDALGFGRAIRGDA
jgi:hypothetical protein